MDDHSPFFNQLKNSIKGDVHIDAMTLGMYATDASNYQIMPIAVLQPINEEDVILAIQIANTFSIPILARGGGTSLVGQTIGKAMILDFTKYMDKVIYTNLDEKWAWIEPGMIRDVLNDGLADSGLHFAPDPATTSRATVGGMIANNSSGTRSILYGKTLDHVLALEVVLMDGTKLICESITSENLEEKLSLNNREGEIYRKLFELVQTNRQHIESHFPKVMRRVGGYNLDEFLTPSWNLSRIITGSEGTLAIILKAKIKLEPLPKFQSLCVVHFADYFDSISHIARINQSNPASVELLDKKLLDLSKENLDTKRYCDFVEGNPEGVLVVEFYGNSLEDAKNKGELLAQTLKEENIGYAWPVYTDKEKVNSVFTVRKKGLGLLLGIKGKKKPIAIIEDAAVPVEYLADYIKEVFTVCKKYDTEVVAYAHASVGLLHVKPLLDLRDVKDIIKMKNIAEETLALVKKYKGSWSGEHGDGLARGPYNKSFFGEEIYQAFIDLKKCFDPKFLMNPGKIVESPPNDTNLRYGPKYHDEFFQSMFHYREEGGFEDSVHLCNGVGECRKHSGGTMCPSYRATKNEQDSTRGRANILRLAMSGQLDDEGLHSPYVMEALELCLSCKACKSECPSNVDMSKLKSEMLHLQNKKEGLKLVSRLIKHQDSLSKLSIGPLSFLQNFILKNKLFRNFIEKISGLDSRRVLPLYTNSSLSELKKLGHQKISGGPKVVLFADTYIKYHDREIGISAFKLLTHLGYEVEIFMDGCCQRPAISKGLLEVAKAKGKDTLEKLKPYLENNIPILICEPSCATALIDDLPDLMDDPDWQKLTKNIFLLEDFLFSEMQSGKLKSDIQLKPGKYIFHGHCHQKAMFSTKSIHQIFSSNSNVSFEEINSGCCGMAGSFGYEKKHYEVSKKIAEQSLILELNTKPADVQILTDGFSCRHQIEHFGGRKARHWVEFVDREW